MSEIKNTKAETLLGLINSLGGVRIPMIQRDYAQGRRAWANPRRRFIDDLADALSPTGKSMHLDFVYGLQLQEDGHSAFCPLDGQQRLTTLFLLHWYLAAFENRFEHFQSHLISKSGTIRFSYQARPWGRAFFEALIKNNPPSAGAFPGGSPGKWIHEVPWFRTSWKSDPTVSGALEMLDAIHAGFQKVSSGAYGRLVDENRTTFNLLDLGEIGLHDDLYLRMNARGRALTQFETFKARYEKHLENDFPQHDDLNRCKVQNQIAFAAEIDKSWLDFIWCRCYPLQKQDSSKDDKSDDTSKVDLAFINLFRVVALVSLCKKPEPEFTNDVKILTKGHPDFDEFENHGWLNPRFTKYLIHLLEAWTDERNGFPLLGENPYFDESAFLDQVAADSTKPSFAEYLQFAAYVRFITHHGPCLNDGSRAALRDWMRVIRNLTLNTDLEADPFGNQLEGLDELARHSHDILKHLCGENIRIKGFNQQQVGEECLKARLLRCPHLGWHDLIHQADNHGYFKGQVGFLLDFSGTCFDTLKVWNHSDHVEARNRFREFLTKAERMFNGKGLADTPRCLWERALLSIGDYIYTNGFNKSLLRNERNLAESWKRLLQGADDDARKRRDLLKELWMQIDLEDDLVAQLDAIIQEHDGSGDWRSRLVHSPGSVEFCSQSWIRKNSDTSVFLLRSSQMNGYNAELFTYCLWDGEGLANDPGKFHPLRCNRYVELKGASGDTSHIFFHWVLGEKELPVHLYFNTDGIPGFSLWFKTAELDEDLQQKLKSCGFLELRDWLYLLQDPKDDLYDGGSFLRKCAAVLGSIPWEACQPMQEN
jgi:hypothetical protein